MIIVDSHQDLAWNMLTFGRDYTRSAHQTRQLEAQTEIPQRNGDTLLGWPDYQRGRVAVVFSTLFVAPLPARLGEWETQVYADANQANRRYSQQLDAYHRLADSHPDEFRLLQNRQDLDQVLADWKDAPDVDPAPAPKGAGRPGDGRRPSPPEVLEENEVGKDVEFEGQSDRKKGPPVGLLPLMEGAEGVLSPEELEDWWERGVRLIGPAWAGTRFCGGTRMPGPLTKEGFALLEGMAGVGFGLDISHMDEQAVLQALDAYPGTIIASHSNAHALLKGMETNRHLSDRVIQGLLEREGVIGVVPFNRFLLPGWTPADGRELVTLEHVFAHIDYICQMAGSARHVGIGTDFDGGFGLQSAPDGIDTIADLRKLIPLMSSKGYADEDIAAVLGLNWIRILREVLPEG